MARWQVTFRDGTKMPVEDATLAGANETAKLFQLSRGKVVTVKPVKEPAKA